MVKGKTQEGRRPLAPPASRSALCTLSFSPFTFCAFCGKIRLSRLVSLGEHGGIAPTFLFLHLASHFSLLLVRQKMTPSAIHEHIFHALFAQGLIVQVVDVQMFFAAAQGALAIVVGEEFSPFDLPCFGSHITVVIERRRSAGQLGAQAFVVEFANPLCARCGLQNFCARLFVHKIYDNQKMNTKNKKCKDTGRVFLFQRKKMLYYDTSHFE